MAYHIYNLKAQKSDPFAFVFSSKYLLLRILNSSFKLRTLFSSFAILFFSPFALHNPSFPSSTAQPLPHYDVPSYDQKTFNMTVESQWAAHGRRSKAGHYIVNSSNPSGLMGVMSHVPIHRETIPLGVQSYEYSVDI
jgi:hypothetical protein